LLQCLQEIDNKCIPGFPEGLSYVCEPVVQSFDSKGGVLRIQDCGFSITVPEDAVAADKVVVVKVAICTCGPFSISEKYRIASDFVVIMSEGSFLKPVDIEMEHCMLMKEYKKCSEVVILKADHLTKTEDGWYTFDDFLAPDVSADRPILTFQAQSFCIFCDAIKVDNLRAFTNPSIDDDNPSSASSSFDDSTELLRPPPTKYSALQRSSDEHSTSRFEGENVPVKKLHKVLSTKALVRKRQSRALLEFSTSMSSCPQSTQPEYCAIMFEPEKNTISFSENFYKFVVFIALNTPGAFKVGINYSLLFIYLFLPQQVCKQRAMEIMESSVKLNHIPITFDSETKSLQLDVEVSSLGWSVEPDKTPTVCLCCGKERHNSYNDKLECLVKSVLGISFIFIAEFLKIYISSY